MKSKLETMVFHHNDREGNPKNVNITYKLWFSDNLELLDVSTVFNQTVTKNSMVFDYFSTKYNV